MQSPETTVTVVLMATVGLYLAAWGVMLFKRERLGWGIIAGAWLVNAGLVLVNWLVAGEPPLGNMYHVQVVLALCFLPLYLVLAWREKLGWTGVYFVFASALPLVGALFMDKDMEWRRLPALQSPWFVPHVLAYMISYALATVGFVMVMVGWVKGRRGVDVTGKDYGRAAYETVRFAFPFMTFGMLSGALWAEEAWGRWWSWDPKETWSLITWTLYVLYFHCRRTPEWRRYATLVLVLAFLALLTTFFLVNLLPKLASALHSYA